MWIALIVVLLIWSAVQFLNQLAKKDAARSVPISKFNYPLIGCGHLFMGKTAEQKHDNIVKLFPTDVKLFRFWLGPKLLYGSCDPEVIQSVLSSATWYDKPFVYDFFDLPLGLFAARIDVWKRQRKVLNPSFNMKILQSFIPIFAEKAKVMVNRLLAVPEGEIVDAMDHTSRCTLEMVTATTIGYDVKYLNDDILGKKVERFFHLVSLRILNFFYYWDPIYRWTEQYREMKELRDYLNSLTVKVLKDKRSQLEKVVRQNGQINSSTNEFKTPQILIDELLTNKLSDEEIFENVFTFIGAGTDTSATTLAFCCLVLALYPDVQQKLYEEVMQLYPETDPTFTMDSLKQLQYMEMVLKETMRLYPIGPVMVRQSDGDATIEGVRVPKGTIFAYNIFNMHRRVDLWGPDAGLFVPERFGPDRIKEVNLQAYLPFNGGSRNCIGNRYAMMSMKIVLVHLIKSFRLATPLREDNLRLSFGIIIRIEGGHLLQFVKR